MVEQDQGIWARKHVCGAFASAGKEVAWVSFAAPGPLPAHEPLASALVSRSQENTRTTEKINLPVQLLDR